MYISCQESQSHGGSLLNTAITEEGGLSPTAPPAMPQPHSIINMDHISNHPDVRDETKF